MDGVHAWGDGWFERRTYDATSAAATDVGDLLTLKRQQAQRVSVVLPARNEAATIGEIVRTVTRELLPVGLVDEVLVVDSHSIDDTAAVARAAGGGVVRQGDVLPAAGGRPGVGRAHV